MLQLRNVGHMNKSVVIVREDLKRDLCFCRNWKSLKELAALTHLTVRLDQIWLLRRWCSTARCCVSLIRFLGIFISEMFIWNNYLNIFPRFCIRKYKLGYSYSCMSLFFLLFYCSKVSFRPLMRRQPGLTDISYCVFNLKMIQSSPVVHGT